LPLELGYLVSREWGLGVDGYWRSFTVCGALHAFEHRRGVIVTAATALSVSTFAVPSSIGSAALARVALVRVSPSWITLL
jgi:hypothetical protein